MVIVAHPETNSLLVSAQDARMREIAESSRSSTDSDERRDGYRDRLVSGRVSRRPHTVERTPRSFARTLRSSSRSRSRPRTCATTASRPLRPLNSTGTLRGRPGPRRTSPTAAGAVAARAGLPGNRLLPRRRLHTDLPEQQLRPPVDDGVDLLTLRLGCGGDVRIGDRGVLLKQRPRRSRMRGCRSCWP